MSQKWNLQDIRPAGQSRPKRTRLQQSNKPDKPTPKQREEIPSIVIEDGTKKNRTRFIVPIVLFLVIVGGATALSGFMGKTELTIYPEFRDPNISAQFTAYNEPREGNLQYEIMTLTEESESQVQASGKVEVEEQASGLIEIRKDTPGAERLIARTRFRSPDGLIYRIQESVVVPGAVTNDAGETVPGTIQARAFADDIGEQYNAPANTTFDLPALEENNSPLFSQISAVATEPVTGGFAGPQFQIEDSELSTARQMLQVDLRNRLLEQIQDNKPAGTIAFPGSVAITFSELPPVEYGTDLVTIREQATLQIPLFKADEFGEFLANEAVATYEGGPVRVEDPTALTFAYTSATTSVSTIANFDSLDFRLTGKPRLIWEYDSETLTSDLAGLPKTALINAINAYPGITGAKAEITPFWQRNFPDDPAEITVTEELKSTISE